MTKKKLTQDLLALLERSPSTAFFLEGVTGAIETLYADGDECPEGFAALDQATQAFDACEADDDDEGDDDEGDDDEGDDDEGDDDEEGDR